MQKINMTFEEFVLNKRLITLFYQKNLLEKINRKMVEFQIK